MRDVDIITILPGLLLVVFVILAEAYWLEAREFYNKALNKTLPKDDRIAHGDNYRRALLMFRIVSFGMLLSLFSAVIPVFIPNSSSIMISKYILGVILIFLVIFLLLMTFGYFVIKYLTPKQLLEKIEEENRAKTE